MPATSSDRAPLTIASQGYFFVGGRYAAAPPVAADRTGLSIEVAGAAPPVAADRTGLSIEVAGAAPPVAADRTGMSIEVAGAAPPVAADRTGLSIEVAGAAPPVAADRTGLSIEVAGAAPPVAADRTGMAMTGQMYVEYQIPHEISAPCPIVMIHGGGQTGTNFTGTPDGREGWAQHFLRRGWPVYVVDTVGRGRSTGNIAAYGDQRAPNLATVQDRFVAPGRAMLWPQADRHARFPGEAKPGDPVFDEFFASQVSSIADYPMQQGLNAEAGAALMDRIGPAVLLVHSQAGNFGWLIADRRPKLVKAIVAVEPNGPPVHDVEFLGAPDWFRDNPAFKEGGLCHLPLTYAPPLAPGERLAVVCEKEPQGPGLVRCWRQAEPARRLPNLAGIPVVIVQGEASYHAPYDHCTSQWLTQAGVENTLIPLAERGIRGNGHMMMIEENNEAIADVIMEWLSSTLQCADRRD